MTQPHHLLKTVFGYDEFRPLQADIIAHILQKRDALVIMPTGGGKSLCYQLPALIMEGLTIVVSPLISLMKDQVWQLREAGVTAAFLNSSLPMPEYNRIMADVKQGAYKLLYVAPETLLKPLVLNLLTGLRVDCLTIDEAHCISMWGHDFRPEYRNLIPVRRRFPKAVCVALTATATPRVREDIRDQLGFTEDSQFIASFNRPNLFLEIAPKTRPLEQTLDFLRAHKDQSGIIYCATRQQVDDLTTDLRGNGFNALPYHAGMDTDARAKNQEAFSRDDVPIMVATVAFGMGINKSNVRFVLHYNLPQSLDNYYQEIGRSGRDGLRADCLLLFSRADVGTIQFLISQKSDDEQRVARYQLQHILAYAETNQCRRHLLLQYFGEAPGAAKCSHCDNCQTERRDEDDLTVSAQKFLSCVKRTREIFGAGHIIDVLRGSEAEKVLKHDHQKLSTYGIGAEYSKAQWQHLSRQFISQGLLTQDLEHGSLKVTDKGWQVMRGEVKVMGTLEERREREIKKAAAELDYNTELFEILRRQRKQLADAAGQPPFVIFSDKTLQEMAAYLPQNRPTMMRIYGMGEVKWDK